MSVIASNLHNKKLKTINEKLIQTFHQTLEVQIIHPYLLILLGLQQLNPIISL